MAIEHIPYTDADNLARAGDKGFYSVPLPISHWQLRNYISTPEPDIVYYASGTDVYWLNTASKKRKHIATVPFTSRCTATGYGWVCVGGELEGQFAAIKLDGSTGSRTLDVDSALPIESWRSSTRRGATINVDRIGRDYLNSISIHRIQDEEAHLDDIVAIVTNNDQTVRVYSLPQGLETTVLDLPFAMNHATLSPDGQVIVAVGDLPQAYFFVRELKDTPPQIPKPHNRLSSSSLDWTLMSVVDLHTSGPEKTNGYFTTAWSPNGQLVAVGSEAGYITVFDMELLTRPDFDDEDAIVAVKAAAQVDVPPHGGAVRSMIFSPEPWDLLIWAEDAGCICIGDLRTGLRSKQLIKIEPREEGLRHIEVEDLPSEDIAEVSRDINNLETSFLQGSQQAGDNATHDASTAAYAEQYINARRRLRQLRQEDDDVMNLRYPRISSSARASTMEEDDPRGLTAGEQQLLDSMRMVRQRDEARANGQVPRTVNYTTPDMFTGSNSRASRSSTPNNGAAASTRPVSDILSAVQDAMPELSRTNAATERPSSSHGPNPHHDLALPPLHLLNDSIWVASRQSSGLVRLSDPSRLPRRRASIILALPNPDTTASGEARQRQITLSSSPEQAPADIDAHMQAEEEEEDDSGWRTISDHMTLARGPLFESAARTANQSAPESATNSEATQSMIATERQRARLIAATRQRERWRALRTLDSSSSAAPVPASGANATRIAGFPDGYDDVAAQQRVRDRIELRRANQIGTVRRGTLSNRLEAANATRDTNGVRTAGLAMSADGRMLWAACEEGIFELEVNVKGRMFWGSVEPL